MGKSDFKKMNCWDEIIDERAALNKFYDTAAQDQPSNGKKKVKVKPKKSNHKHDYQKVLIKYEDWDFLAIGRQCKICGKLQEDWFFLKHPSGERLTSYEEAIKLPEYKDLPLVNGGKFI